ncbi:MAG: CoA ester lyase [Pseudomonadota bacterium]
MRPYRSVLYVPGSNVRAMDKARTLPVDALILDLEDAVAPDAKAQARADVCDMVQARGFGHRPLIVRINGLDTPWGGQDLDAVVSASPDAILLPKVAHADDLLPVQRALGPDAQSRIWAMIESPAGVLNAATIARADGMEGFVLGTNDLAKDLGARDRADRLPLQGALSMALLAARAAGILCIDGVYNAFRDEDGLRQECLQGRDMGFDGKTLIHPAQLAVANEVFAPAPAAVDLARRQVDAYEAALASGAGVAVLDGRIVENLHVEAARQTLAKADTIARMD